MKILNTFFSNGYIQHWGAVLLFMATILDAILIFPKRLMMPGWHHAVSELLSKNLPLIMVFRRKFLYGGRQKKYFHVKILIIVCPNRTCKNFENR